MLLVALLPSWAAGGRRPPHSATVGGLAFGFVCARCLLRLLLFVAWPLCFLLHLWGATLSVLGAKPVCYRWFPGTSHFPLLGKHIITAWMTATGKFTPAWNKTISKQRYGKANYEPNIFCCIYWVCLPSSAMVDTHKWAERVRGPQIAMKSFKEPAYGLR